MKKMIQYKIGAVIHDCGLRYKVVESSSCADCALFVASENRCSDYPANRFGACGEGLRDDNKSVVFKLIEK